MKSIAMGVADPTPLSRPSEGWPLTGYGADQDRRVLHRLDLRSLIGAMPDVVQGPTRVVGIVDVETLGVRDEPIIELAVRRLRVDAGGDIVELGRMWEFLEDPGVPVAPEIERLTGLGDADLAGQRIDEAIALSVLRSCDVLAAHKAAFDRPRIVSRLPEPTNRSPAA